MDRVETVETAEYSFWLKQALEQEPERQVKALSQDIDCDIAIVGGGYTGLWTAIMLKQQAPEKKVVMIEKDLCGSGASGANGGCLLTWSTKYPTLKKLFGEQEARWLVKQSEHAVYDIEGFCRQYGIDAQLYRHGTYYTATNQAQKGNMQPIVDELTKLGINSWEKQSDQTIGRQAGSALHIEGYYSPAAASVQPALLARGLRRVAMDLGIEVYEKTEMQEVKYGQPARVVTPQGTITADKVVLAINAWMTSRFRQFKRSIVVVSSDMVVTAPIPEKLKKQGPEQGVTVVDSRIFVHYYRDTADGRLMLGKGGNHFSYANRVEPMFNRQTRYLELLASAFSRLFPGLEQPEIADSWTGGSDRSTTGLPFFGYLAKQPNIVYGLGYSGNGVAQTHIGGKILTSMVLEKNDRWANCGLTGGPRGYFPPEPFRWCGAMIVRNAIRRKESAEDRGATPLLIDRWLAKLAGPAGKADKVS